jgi:hypothetical protein
MWLGGEIIGMVLGLVITGDTLIGYLAALVCAILGGLGAFAVVRGLSPIHGLQNAVSSEPPGWYADPARKHELRYWDGLRWTEHVSSSGIASVDTGEPGY